MSLESREQRKVTTLSGGVAAATDDRRLRGGGEGAWRKRREGRQLSDALEGRRGG